MTPTRFSPEGFGLSLQVLLPHCPVQAVLPYTSTCQGSHLSNWIDSCKLEVAAAWGKNNLVISTLDVLKRNRIFSLLPSSTKGLKFILLQHSSFELLLFYSKTKILYWELLSIKKHAKIPWVLGPDSTSKVSTFTSELTFVHVKKNPKNTDKHQVTTVSSHKAKDGWRPSRQSWLNTNLAS